MRALIRRSSACRFVALTANASVLVGARLVADESQDPNSTDDTPDLPENIAPADLEALNRAVSALFQELRLARSLLPGETHGRLGAVVALGATWRFLMRFEPVLSEGLQVSLVNLHGALLALNANDVMPLLRPTATPVGGRAPDSPERQRVVGCAAGAVERLRWTGMARDAAHRSVAETLHKIGIGSSRGSGRITARTVRGWCERVAADVCRNSIAALNAQSLVSDKWRERITAHPPADSRKYILRSLESDIRQFGDSGRAAAKKPSNDPS
jgi:hypothetical protein